MGKMIGTYALTFAVMLSCYIGWKTSEPWERKKFFKAVGVCATIAALATAVLAGVVYIF